MALKREGKEVVIMEVAEQAKVALSAAIADYRGLTVGEMDALRVQARHTGVYLKVVRNTLARLAVKDTEFECISDRLVGPIVLAFSKDEPGAAARLFRDYCKTNDKLEVKALVIGGQAMGPEQLNALAKLPTRDEALASLMSVMQAPITKLVRTIAEPKAKMARAFAAVRDAKQ